MERVLSADLERVASSMSADEENFLNIQLLSIDSSLSDAHIRVPEGQIARDAIQAAYATLTVDQMRRIVVTMAGEEIDMAMSFSSNGIECRISRSVWRWGSGCLQRCHGNLTMVRHPPPPAEFPLAAGTFRTGLPGNGVESFLIFRNPRIRTMCS